MLTVFNMNMVAGDDEVALAEAEDVLDSSLSPHTFARAGSRAEATANSMWLGSAEVLQRFGVKRGAEVFAEHAALVLQGRHAITGVQVLRPRNRVVRSYELTFWAPESLAWAWVQSGENLRAQIERAVLGGAGYSLQYLTQSSLNGAPMRGFGASLVLHIRTPTAHEETTVPGPVLHVHCHLAAVLDAEAILRAPDGEMLFGNDAILAAGAAGRAVLAQEVRNLGFGIEAETGPKGRYFEVIGVPKNRLRPDFWTHAECTHRPALRG